MASDGESAGAAADKANHQASLVQSGQGTAVTESGTITHNDTSGGEAPEGAVGLTTTTVSAAAKEEGPRTDSPLTASRKRKSPGHDADLEPDDHLQPGDGVKKLKLAEPHREQPGRRPLAPPVDYSLLPAEIWHHIFTYCPPRSLGSLLRVNKLFNLYLDPSSMVHREVPVSMGPSALAVLKPAAIWRASRILFWPQMPSPLRSKSELDMWRLACSPRCQYCNKSDPRFRSSSSQPPHPGPGMDGIAIIWPFAIRVCAACLLQKTTKV